MSTDNPNANPYQPNPDRGTLEIDQPIQLPEGQQRGMVGQTTVLGVLMIVQGVLNGLAGVCVAGYAVLMPKMMNEMQNQPNGAGGQPPMPENFALYFGIGGAILSVVVLISAGLLIYSGIGVMRFERRSLAIGSLCFAMVSFFTCYCFPTSFALGIYGLILLLNQPVVQAFALRSKGYTARRIQQAFLSLP